MKDGFIRVCAATPEVAVADPIFNGERIIHCIEEAVKQGAKLIVLPELCITGYTCGELFLQESLLDAADAAVKRIRDVFRDEDILICVGAPVRYAQKLYNCGIALCRGEVKAVVPKRNLPSYGEFYEGRYFSKGMKAPVIMRYLDQEVLFGSDILIQAVNLRDFTLGIELCEDLWTVNPPSNRLAVKGATVIANLSASNETIGKDSYRYDLVKSQSARLYCAYVYADAGEGESTGDLVFAGDNLIAQNGTVLARSRRFENGNIYAEIDVMRLAGERKRVTTFPADKRRKAAVTEICFALTDTPLAGVISKTPFVPEDHQFRETVCEHIFMMQAAGLKKRMAHTQAKTAVLGVSGGLDSTLALLVTARAFDLLKKDRK